MFQTLRRLEFNGLGFPVNERVVEAKPIKTQKDGVVPDVRDVERKALMMCGYCETKRRGAVGDRSRCDGTTVDDVYRNFSIEASRGYVVLANEGSIDEGIGSTGVEHSVSCNSPLPIYYGDRYDEVLT